MSAAFAVAPGGQGGSNGAQEQQSRGQEKQQEQPEIVPKPVRLDFTSPTQHYVGTPREEGGKTAHHVSASSKRLPSKALRPSDPVP